ncbi:phosphopantetheine-binding protein [Lysobacter yananisis]|uniref:Phosphopantetheine-binding protein n=1 Tax=Lysobacter yananisis TaxID=1003114 RepID=A0ABY9PE35_9GAMM|nr:phosphopantetheine-binding protein [Lysobacter yananisis]WMT05330.1 phosphopantetheine-binding protein [Lysobacter yananisis]
MDKSRVIDILKQIIAEDLDLNIGYDQVDDAASFLEDGLALDSISMAEFINLLERRFQIRILDEDLESATFQSLDNVAALVQKRLAESAFEVGA